MTAIIAHSLRLTIKLVRLYFIPYYVTIFLQYLIPTVWCSIYSDIPHIPLLSLDVHE